MYISKIIRLKGVFLLAVSLSEFKREYTKAITEGYAAIFAGAGLSRSSGYVNWKELLRTIAQDINLDVDRETDLIAVAQYYKNERGGRRGDINQIILNEFTKNSQENINIEILTRLPIDTYWTTNYDELIEKNLEKNNRKPDIKTTQNSLANNIYDRDAVVYKMHGDVRNPSEAVITKDDYETYNIKRALFSTALQGDLISKTFLFIGFSFEDPNLEYILSRIKVLLGENTRTHYCFLKKVLREDYENEKEYDYMQIKQDLKVKDLNRYGIEAVLLDDYTQITEILFEIENKYRLNNIFISGSADEFDENWNREKAIRFMHLLSKRLVENNYKIISGFGNGVGSSIINGALEEIMATKYRHLDEHLCLRPFPQIQSGDKTLSELWDSYRKEMISDSGIDIFIFGNKKEGDKTVIADGVLKEYKIAKERKKYIIPIGSTGYAAREIFEEVKTNIHEYPYIKDFLVDLENETDENNLVLVVLKIISEIKRTH
ncbi:MAG: hypothetical protein PWP27_971 [Clostridiales bacterium]|jgi:hypothetical protein|nr:hypothetical protein [Clostridiales bacterium]